MFNELISQILNRDNDSNKYSFGHVLIIGGSPGMVGAPLLAGRAALRIGAGLVTIASTPEVIEKLEERVEEIMTLRIDPDNIEPILEFIKKRHVNVLVIGPGMDETFARCVRPIISKTTQTVIVDAGALTSFANHLEELTGERFIITPHDGEFKKLTGITLSNKRDDRIDAVSRFVNEQKLTFICKGGPTLIGHADGTVIENSTGNPGLATAGSGDVLAGIIAGILAQNIDVYGASELGVYLHGRAADIAIIEKTQPGLIATDIIEALPDALKSQEFKV